MTPKEKAEELYNKFHFVLPSYTDEGQIEHKSAKESALIAVDEILKSNPTKINCDSSELNYGYYQEVKQEIEKL